MDKKLRQILDNFSMELHKYEEEGGDLPPEIDALWEEVTVRLLMEE